MKPSSDLGCARSAKRNSSARPYRPLAPNVIPRRQLVGRASLYLKWAKPDRGKWHFLDSLDLTQVAGYGVYVIWKRRARGRSSAAVRVGSGDLAACIAMDRADLTIANHGRGLRITWAKLEPLFAGDVEVYLAQQLRPLVGERFPLSPAIEINLPMLR